MFGGRSSANHDPKHFIDFSFAVLSDVLSVIICKSNSKTASAPRVSPFRTSRRRALSSRDVWYSSGRTIKISNSATNRSKTVVPPYWKLSVQVLSVYQDNLSKVIQMALENICSESQYFFVAKRSGKIILENLLKIYKTTTVMLRFWTIFFVLLSKIYFVLIKGVQLCTYKKGRR